MGWFSKIFNVKFSYKNKGELYLYLCQLLGFQPNDVYLYKQALTHRSVSGASNERLEYLGDALISLVVAEELYKLYPNADEGFLSQARSHAVCRDNLNRIAHQLIIDEHLITAQPIRKNTENIYGNALEALVGAAYLDMGFMLSASFVRKVLVGKNGATLLKLSEHETDFKSRLLEYANAHRLHVEFVQSGERYEHADDRHVFIFDVLVNDKQIAQAAGYSKREAQQIAAKKALKQIKKVKTL